MVQYILPQTQVFQEIELQPAVGASVLNACVIGPFAQLVRYANTDEKEFGNLGAYDPLIETCYAWPNREAGAVVDESYTKVFIQDALLRYFHDVVGGGSVITKDSTLYNNRITSATLAFKANGDDYPRSLTEFPERDVQIGDVAHIRANVMSVDYFLETTVKGFVGTPVAAVVGTADDDPTNAATQSPLMTIDKLHGPDNCVVAGVPGTWCYDGLTSGYINEVYNIKVIQGSVGGDATTARLRITSASGTDDQASIAPSAYGADTYIGTRGAAVVFDMDGASCSVSASISGVSPDDFVVGQEWEVTVQGDWGGYSSSTSAGTYSGTTDTTYIIEITRGAVLTNTSCWTNNFPAQITVTTADGSDFSGPQDLSNAAPTLIGTKGVQFSLAAGGGGVQGFRKGDKFTIAVEAEKEGFMRTLILNHNVFSESDVPDGTEVDLDLFIKHSSEEISANRTGFAPLTNWTQDDLEICLQDGIVATDPTWTISGVPDPLPILFGTVYVEYRAWIQTLCNEINSIFTTDELDAIPGSLDVDNPGKWGVFKAISNSNSVPVRYLGVCNPLDLDSWVSALEILDGKREVYGLVPLTKDRDVLELFKAHVLDQSGPLNNTFRMLWTNLADIVEQGIVTPETTTDGLLALAVLEDNPDQSGTQYTRLRVPLANSQFITNGVRAGDIVRFLYVSDGFGGVTYTSFVVDSVTSEDELLLLTGHSVAISTPQRMEIWRNLTPTEEATALAQVSGSWANRRVISTWPDQITSAGVLQEGYFANCAAAGLISGVAPHQGLTRLEISGFDNVDRTTKKFGKAQLDIMAAAGTWIFTQDPNTGVVFTRHAVTTTQNQDNILEREEVCTRNIDEISFEVFDTFEPFIGVSNVTETLIQILGMYVTQTYTTINSRNRIGRLGPQLVSGTVDRLFQSETLKDHIILESTLLIPSPVNVIEAHLKLQVATIV